MMRGDFDMKDTALEDIRVLYHRLIDPAVQG